MRLEQWKWWKVHTLYGGHVNVELGTCTEYVACLVRGFRSCVILGVGGNPRDPRLRNNLGETMLSVSAVHGKNRGSVIIISLEVLVSIFFRGLIFFHLFYLLKLASRIK